MCIHQRLCEMERSRPRNDTISDTRPEQQPEMNDERFEQLRCDPRVIIHQKKAELPFEPFIRVNDHVDVLELIGRREPQDEPNGPCNH